MTFWCPSPPPHRPTEMAILIFFANRLDEGSQFAFVKKFETPPVRGLLWRLILKILKNCSYSQTVDPIEMNYDIKNSYF